MNDEFSMFAGVIAAVIVFIIHTVRSLSREKLEDAVNQGLAQHEKMKAAVSGSINYKTGDCHLLSTDDGSYGSVIETINLGRYPKMKCAWCRTDLKLDREGRCTGCGAPTCE